MTDASEVRSSYTASLRLNGGGTPTERRVKAFYEKMRTMDDPADPERKLTPQRILTEALVALEERITNQAEKEEPPDESTVVLDRLDAVEQSVERNLVELRNQIIDVIREGNRRLEQRIDGLVRQGVLTPTQADRVKAEVSDELDADFKNNMAAAFKPGRRK